MFAPIPSFRRMQIGAYAPAFDEPPRVRRIHRFEYVMKGVPLPRALDPATQRRMSRTRQRDNAREVALRSILHRRGLRFRIHLRLLPGSTRTVDIVFVRARLAIFLDGCFWHGCPDHASWPKTNAEWWRNKIETNRQRDQNTHQRLCAGGWTVLRIWEHQSLDEAVACVVTALEHGSQGESL
jgi:DNA mismatch endonuclease (patch repair protein)